MKILTFSDLHTPCIEAISNINFNNLNYDICFTLGDLDFETLKTIQNNVKCSIYAVLGNHDEYNLLSDLNIQSIDRKKINVAGISFVGLSGSSRYKLDNKSMLTQKESIQVCKELEPADILISHDCAFGLYGSKSDNTHCGLKGISKYIKKYKPWLNIHGHYHQNKIIKCRNTTDICIYGCAIITLNYNYRFEIKHIFSY